VIESRSDERCRLQCRCRVAQRRALWLRALVLSVDAVYMMWQQRRGGAAARVLDYPSQVLRSPAQRGRATSHCLVSAWPALELERALTGASPAAPQVGSQQTSLARAARRGLRAARGLPVWFRHRSRRE